MAAHSPKTADWGYVLAIRILIISILLAVSIADARTHRIPDSLVFLLLLAAALPFVLGKRTFSHANAVFPTAVLAVLCLVSRFSKGFGMGDAKLLTVLSLHLDFFAFLGLVFISCSLAIMFIAARRMVFKDGEDGVPFAPFVFI